MSMDRQNPGRDVRRQSAHGLSSRERVIAGLAGGALLIVGIVAVFIAKSDIGSLALVTVGALFLLIGVLALVPTGLKVGQNEVTLARTPAEAFTLESVEDAQTKFAHGDTEGALQSLRAVAEPPVPQLALSRDARQFLVLREEIQRAIRIRAPDWHVDVDFAQALDAESRPYVARLYSKEDKSEVLVALLLSQDDGHATDPIAFAEGHAFRGVIVVIPRQGLRVRPEEYIATLDSPGSPHRGVVWGTDDQFEQLDRAVRSLYGLPTAGR
jgi:hypothetical protein